MPQSQDFSDLSHRRSLCGHWTSLLVKAKWSACRDSLADSESATPLLRGVADFDQNGWPDCARTGGRIAPDSLADFVQIMQLAMRTTQTT
jgi:hypothetical protein